ASSRVTTAVPSTSRLAGGTEAAPTRRRCGPARRGRSAGVGRYGRATRSRAAAAGASRPAPARRSPVTSLDSGPVRTGEGLAGGGGRPAYGGPLAGRGPAPRGPPTPPAPPSPP